MAKPKVYFDMTVGGQSVGRIVMEVCTNLSKFKAVRAVFYGCFTFEEEPNTLAACTSFYVFIVTEINFLVLLQLRADVVPKTAGTFSDLLCTFALLYNVHSSIITRGVITFAFRPTNFLMDFSDPKQYSFIWNAQKRLV